MTQAENLSIVESKSGSETPRKRKLALTASILLCGLALAPGSVGRAESQTPNCTDYLYAGKIGPEPAGAVTAVITELADPQVPHGHVAAWIGVGGPAMGPNGANEWLQAGIVKEADQYTSHLYYEVAQPHQLTKLVALGPVAVGAPKALRVEELIKSPNHWAIYVNGRRRSPIFFLPASHGAFRPNIMAEQWGGGSAANPDNTCNTYEMNFSRLKASAPGDKNLYPLSGAGKLQNPGYELSRVTTDGFTARNQEQ